MRKTAIVSNTKKRKTAGSRLNSGLKIFQWRLTLDRLKRVKANLKPRLPIRLTAFETAIETAVETAVRTAVRTLQKTPTHTKTGKASDAVSNAVLSPALLPFQPPFQTPSKAIKSESKRLDFQQSVLCLIHNPPQRPKKTHPHGGN